MIDFNKIVNKLSSKGPIVLLEDIEELIDPTGARGAVGKREVYKVAYQLRSQGYMQLLRNGLFLFAKETARTRQAISTAKEDISRIEKYYWDIVAAYIRREVRSEYFIGGPKAIELHLSDMSTPGVLVVYTKSTNKTLKISSMHTIVFKTIEAGGKTKGNLFGILKKFSEIQVINERRFKILGHEAALLDALLTHRGGLEPDIYLVRKFLLRYAETLSRETLGTLVSLRYISSINRLREISKSERYTQLYQTCISVIRDEGAGCFLTFLTK